MAQLLKNFIFVVLIFLVISAIFASLWQPKSAPSELSLSQLVSRINQDKVKKILIQGNDLQVILSDDQKASSRKEPEAALSQTLVNYGVDKEKLQLVEIEVKKESGTILVVGQILSFVLPLLLFVVFFWFMFRQAKVGATQAFDFTKAKARLFGAEGHPQEKITFKDVAGLKEAKEELKEVVDFLKNPKKFLNMGAKIPRGVLLLGPAGVGKTLLARAIAGESNVPFFHSSGSSFVELFVGVGSARIRDLFALAKKHVPSIIFLDELDAIGKSRGAGLGGSHDEREQTLNQLLVEMDGFERETNVIVVAATNRADVLDSALLRPGRFDRRIILDLPDINDREEILKIHARGKPLSANLDLREVAERTPGFSGADLANVANEAAILAARKNKTQISQDDFLESIEKVLLGPERKSHILSKKEKEITAFHEVGHALVAAFSPGVEPVRKISIIARGMAAGYTLKMPSEERKIRSKSEFLAEIAVSLGGYCAEKIKFGEITTGASNDLEKASTLARKLVKEYGMSSLGPINFRDNENDLFWPQEISGQRPYSEETAVLIDKEVEKFINQARQSAEKTLGRRQKLMEKVARVLIEKEIIERREFEELIRLRPEEEGKGRPKLRSKSTNLKIKVKQV
ncbi:MAG: ATP-dependent metallopeptidase FtsH/Yme1/Tma family protein [Candidatus Nealsonbacteria bacterium]|nr:ATP-dependent metallopeptidase FtsH/Yme1/Tma family protein [Candidatus Nealsonbacteria bacterium]